jgi:hypothetical protein
LAAAAAGGTAGFVGISFGDTKMACEDHVVGHIGGFFVECWSSF